MRRHVCFVVLMLTIFSYGFCHKSHKQAEQINAESLTEKWLACESSAEEDYQTKLEDFLLEVKKNEPSDTIIYYFPEAKKIYDNLLSGINESNNQKITENVREWEILQKNITQFQLEQLYHSYRILIAVIIILLLLTFIFLVMYLVTSKSRKENKAFTVQMLKAQEAERERISNELHDTVCQDLRELQFRLEDKKTVSLCKKIASDVRNTCYALTPSDLNEGLFEAILSLCALCKQVTGLNVILSIQDDIKHNPCFKDFSRDKNLNIYRIVQEILNNSIKHAQAETISILIRSFDAAHFRIIISDDGKGFDLKTALKKKNHFGLKSMSARVEALSGEISFYSEADAGTQVTITVPYDITDL